MSRKVNTCNAKVCLAAAWAVVSIIFISHAQANAMRANQKSAAAEGVTRLPFGGAAPLPGVLAISSDGRIAAHIGTNGDVVLWDAVKVMQLESIPADGKKPSAVALSPDGDLVAIGYFDSRVIIRSRREHKSLHEFNGHTGGVSALVFSLNGQMLASGGDDATTQLWEVSTGRRLRIFDSQFGGSEGGLVVSVGFSGNGRALVVNEWYSRHYDVGRGTTLWDIEEGIEISTREVAPPNSDNVMRAGQALGGGGWLLAYTGNEGLMVERLDRCESPRQLPSGRFAETVASDPQGRWVAASEMEKLTFFGTSGNTKNYSITLPARAISLVAHPDGRTVFALMIKETQRHGNEHIIIGRDAETVTGGALYRIPVPAPLWDLPPLVVKKEATHCAPTETVRLKQDFKLPGKSMELTVTAKLVPTKAMTTDPEDPTGEYNQVNPPHELYFAQDGSLYALYYAYSNFRSGVVVWNLQTKRLIRARFKQIGSAYTIRLREGWGATAETFTDLLTGKAFYQLRNDERQDSSTVTADQDTGEVFRIVAGHFERYSPAGKRLIDVPTSGTVTAFSARNGRLAALYSDGKIQVWPLKTSGKSKMLMLLPGMKDHGGCGISSLELSANGEYVQISFDCVDSATDYQIFNLSSAKVVAGGMLLTPFLGQANLGVVQDTRPHHLAVWDFDKGAIIARLPRHRSRDKNGVYKPLRAALSDDGRLLASASYDGLVRVWDLKTRQVVGEGRLGGAVTTMAFDLAGRQLAAGREDGQLFVFQVPEP